MTLTTQRSNSAFQHLARPLSTFSLALGIAVAAFTAAAQPPEPPARAKLLMSTAAAESPTRSDVAATSTDCVRRYHARLAAEVLPLARSTQSIADDMRALDPGDMPGYWQFWNGSGIAARTAHQQSLLAAPIVDTSANRLCARQILARGGRIRCLQWQPLPPDYEPPTPKSADVEPSKPEITAAERLIAARLSRRVSARGRFPEFDRDTALYHLAQRTTDELVAYAGQPYRGVLCSGALEMVGFYRRQLLPLQKRAMESERLHRLTEEIAHETAAAALATPQSLPAKQLDHASIIHALLSPVLTSEEFSAVTGHEAPIRQLEQARTYLTDARFDELPAEQRGVLRKALRNMEFAIYAKYEQAHLGRLTQAFDRALDGVQRIHKKNCTCTLQ